MTDLGQWTKQWKHSAVCPIFKKKDPAVFTNYRPISLIDVLSKLLETQIARHLTKSIIENEYLPENQYGFRPKHSCSDLAMTVIGKAMTSINERKPFHLLQTDIAGAFDRVDRSQLKQRLREAGVSTRLHQLLSAYLNQRSFHVRLSGVQSEQYPLDVGVVQGSGLGPIMWNVFFAQAFDATGESGIGFADDLNIMSSDPQQLKEAKERVETFCKNSRITMEPSKEIQTTFFPPRHPDKTSQNPTRLVGIILDQDLTMEPHITTILQKTRVIKTKLMRTKPYCNERQLLSLYKTLIWSMLEYGNVCYSHASPTATRKLERFQSSTIRMLGLDPTVDSLNVRRKTAHATMTYKQTVLNQGPSFIKTMFPPSPPDQRAHLRRSSTIKHAFQLTIPRATSNLKKFDQFCASFIDFNNIPPELIPVSNSIQLFRANVAQFLRSTDDSV